MQSNRILGMFFGFLALTLPIAFVVAQPAYNTKPNAIPNQIGYREGEGRPPITAAEVDKILRDFRLTIASEAGTIIPGSLTTSQLPNGSIFGRYKVKKNTGGAAWDMTFRIERLAVGRPCFHYGNGICETLLSSESEAARLGAAKLDRDLKEEAQERADRLAAEQASNRREPGALLNAKDRACLATSYDRQSRVVDGDCLETFGTAQNRSCSRYAPRTVYYDVPYEVNKCSYTITFKDQCGRTIFGVNTIAPGQRVRTKFQAPCIRVY